MSLSIIALPIIFAVLKVAAIAIIGWLLARKSILHDSATADISELVIKVAVPCLVGVNAAKGIAGMSGVTAVTMMVAGPAVLAVGYVISVVLARLLHVDPGYRKAVVAASTFQNSAYLPLAVGAAVSGVAAASLSAGRMTAAEAASATIVDISLFGVIYSPIFWGIGLSWLTNNGDPGAAFRRGSLSRLFPPPVIGLLIGYAVGLTPLHLLLTPVGAPLRFLFDAASDIGGLTVPLANLVLGAMLARAGGGLQEPLKNHVIVLLTRFALTPSLFLTLIWLTHGWWNGSSAVAMAAFVIFLQSLTPPATNLAVMSKKAERASLAPEDRTSEAIPRLLLVAYLVAMIAMPIWLMVFLRMMGSP